jgi:hypothetical protein
MGLGGSREALAILPPGKTADARVTAGWIDPRAGRDRNGIRYPDRTARSESLYRLHYPGPDVGQQNERKPFVGFSKLW